MAKIQADAEKNKVQAMLDREDMMLKDDRERDKVAADIALRLATIQSTAGATITQAQVNAMIAETRAQIDAEARRDVAHIQAGARGTDGD